MLPKNLLAASTFRWRDDMGHPTRRDLDRNADPQFLAALAAAGFPVSSVVMIRDQYDPLPSRLAALLLEWIPRLEDRRHQESVAWALLGAPQGMLDGAVLGKLFDSVTDEGLKWAIASVINQTRPQNIETWLLNAVRNRQAGASRNLLAAAIAKMVTPERAVPVLMEVFRDVPLAAVHPLGKLGDSHVKEFLIAQQPNATGPLRRELRQAIARIKRRLAKS